MSGPESVASGPGPAGAEPVGSVAEEAFKLFRAMASSSSSSEASAANDGEDPHVCTTTWCPVCQVVGFVRDNPEVVSSVKQSAAQLARSLRDLVDTALAPQEEQ